MFFERFHEISRRSENRSLEEEHPISRTNGVYRFAIVTAPSDPSLIINNFSLAASGLHVSDMRREFCPSSIRLRERCGAPLSGLWTILSRRSGLEKGGRELAVPPPSKLGSPRSLSWSFYLTKRCARAMHTSSGNLDFRCELRYSVLSIFDASRPRAADLYYRRRTRRQKLMRMGG